MPKTIFHDLSPKTWPVGAEPTDLRSVPCFASGTLIRTAEGERPIERLRAGDRVITRNRGIQELCHVEQVAGDKPGGPNVDPVHIPANAIAAGLPERELSLSPRQTIRFDTPLADLLFASDEIYIAARHLVGWNGVTQTRPDPRTRYYTIAFACNEMVLANGVWTDNGLPRHSTSPWSTGQSDAHADNRANRNPRRQLQHWEARIFLAPSLHEQVMSGVRRPCMVEARPIAPSPRP